MSSKKVSVALALLVICFLSSCTSKELKISCGISAVSQIGVNHLQPLVDAMEKYKNDNGRYPKSFDLLLPKYIEKIPIIVTGKEESIDKSKFDLLQNEKLYPGLKNIEDNGNYFSVEFLTTDDRICLLGGRNNICEYSSDRPFWNCHQ